MGVDLLAVIDGRSDTTPEVVLWLLRWLPEGSAWSASIAGGPAYRTWTAPVILAAAQVNALNAANWQRGGGKGKKPSFIEPPKPKARDTPPGEKPKRGMRKPGAIAARAIRGAATRSGTNVSAASLSGSLGRVART